MRTRRVRLVAYWVDDEDDASEASGSLVLHRETTLLDPAEPAVHEVWRTGSMVERDVVVDGWAELDRDVRRLLNGRVAANRVRVGVRAVAHRVDDEWEITELRSVGEHVGPVLDVTVVLPGPTSRDAFAEVDLRSAAADRIGAVVRRELQPLVAEMALAGVVRPQPEQPGFAGPSRAVEATADAPETLGEALGRIVIHDGRGVQIGQHNLQVNRFIARARPVDVDFADVLRRDDIRAAIRDLHADPGNSALRDALVGKLSDEGWIFTPARVTLPVGRRDRDARLCEEFDGTVVFGLQIGSGSVQRNEFFYVVPPFPSAAAVLRGNTDLARDLVESVCPRPGRESDVGLLRERFEASFRDAVDSTQVDWNGLPHAERHALPRPGQIVHLDRVDGATIGPRNRQENIHAAELGKIRVTGLNEVLAKQAEDRRLMEVERVERERVERERVERQRVERERVERDRVERERLDRVNRERQRREQEREQLEQERLERERLEQERFDREYWDRLDDPFGRGDGPERGWGIDGR